MVRAHKLVQDVASHFEVIARDSQRCHDVLLGVSLLHEPINVLQIDVLVGHVDVAAAVIVYAVEGNQISARFHFYILVQLEVVCT